MTTLTVYKDYTPEAPMLETQDGDLIRQQLNGIGVRFERWAADEVLADDADPEDVLRVYSRDVEKLKRENGYLSADVIRIRPDNPNKDALRTKFLNEHTHSEDEVRFFVEGAGAFYLRVDGNIYRVICEKNDLISVPTGIKHWFDMGPSPSFTCIRLFESQEGWVANFTGDAIADQFPKFETAA